MDPLIGKAGDVDTAVLTLKMEDDTLVVIDNCRRSAYGYDQRVEVFGSKGMVSISNDTDSSAVISNAQGVSAEKPQFFFLERYMESYEKEIRSFIHSIATNEDTPVNVVDGLKPVVMALAAKKSQEEHRPVDISEIL